MLEPVLSNIESNSWNSAAKVGEIVMPATIPVVVNGDEDPHSHGGHKMKKHFYYVL